MKSKTSISGTAILHLLNLIVDCDNNIAVLRQTGETETGLLMRQERHLKKNIALNSMLF
jgi:hypothetical protein